MAHVDTALAWLRRDIRFDDNTVLAEASSRSQNAVPVFVFDTTILGPLDQRDDTRVTFIHDSLTELKDKFREVGSDLVVLAGDPIVEIPKLAQKLMAKTVVAGRDPEPYAKHRDSEVAKGLKESGCKLVLVKDQVVLEGPEVLTLNQKPYRVYTAFRKTWFDVFSEKTIASQTAHEKHFAPQANLGGLSADWSLEALGFARAEPWLKPGEEAAKKLLAEFATRVDAYQALRDFPAKNATSHLSAHLRFGTISPRALVRFAMANPSEGADKWLYELVWREFYQSLLWHYPSVVDKAFNPAYENVEWPGDMDHFEAWKKGQTGFPIVDAAMRCLDKTGWMHNRLRMVTASFFVKDLLLDWRLGEAWFARKLLDFDLASNNGGWQWAASTGSDAQPYYRIFNPVLQSRKFDPEGEFIRQWCPELADFDNDTIYWPHQASRFIQLAAGCIVGENYPHPIVDHAVQAEKAKSLLAAYARKMSV